MKRIIPILLLGIYSVSTLGLNLKSFYCCGKLKSVSIIVAQDEHQKYSNDDGMGDCCKTKFQFFKVKDNHFAGDVIKAPALHFCYLHLFTSPFRIIKYPSQETYVAHLSNAPPLIHTVPDYIFDCDFRI